MARPRKTNSEDLIRIVNSFFENDGNPANLKYVLLEKYAATLGIGVKAYDFRRNEEVRKRIEELRNSIVVKGVGVVAYRSMDIDAMLYQNRTREKLRGCLVELNESWRRVYEKAAELSQTNNSLLSELFSKKQEIKKLITENEKLTVESETSKVCINKLTVENRYLKSMFKKYLYPALANEILREEKVLDEVDTEVTQAALDKMLDSKAPLSFSGLVEPDRKEVSRTELLIERMRNKVTEES